MPESKVRDMLPAWRSIVFRLVVSYFVLTVLAVAGSLYLLSEYQRSEIQEKFGRRLEAVAASTAPHIAATDIVAIRTDDDAKSAEFGRVRNAMEQARAQNDLAEDQVYIVRPGKQPGEYPFVAMLQERTFIGDVYHPPAEVEQAYKVVLDEQKPARTRLFTDDHGTFISGLAPIIGEDGRAVAILHADEGVDSYLVEEQEVLMKLGLTAAAIILIMFFIGLGAYRYMNVRVRALLRGAYAIRDGDFDTRLGLSGTNELVQIGNTLDHAMEKLKERFEMLKFLPRHTAEMIADQSREGTVSLDLARRVDVVVLESDIRGFTSLSEHMDPEDVIAMLNTYVRLQAEIIEAHHGSIDKYMGDAVLAVFDGDDRHTAAIDCALRIQAEVEQRNLAPEFGEAVHIGIGIADGEVVMGNMGSERRMEHTVIGSTVNLAARLCSAAAACEIVVTHSLWQAARPDDPPDDVEPITAKGFAAPIDCVRLGPDAGLLTAVSVSGGA